MAMTRETFTKAKAPEKIYGWLDTQMSIARHYGGLKYLNHSCVIDFNDPDQPLVRQDIFQAEKKAKKAPKTEQKPDIGDLFKQDQLTDTKS
jgi:hypothetical protein